MSLPDNAYALAEKPVSQQTNPYDQCSAYEEKQGKERGRERDQVLGSQTGILNRVTRENISGDIWTNSGMREVPVPCPSYIDTFNH